MVLPLLILGLSLVSVSLGATVRNGVNGDPEVECASDSILINFNTAESFEGHVYVKGHYNDGGCRTDATLSRAANIVVPFDACGVKRQRSANPQGLYISTTVVISFHPMFITMVDKAYNIRCFYMEADKTVTAGLDVSLGANQHERIVVMLGGSPELASLLDRNESRTDLINMLSTEVITRSIPMPTCKYEVLQGGTDGPVVRFATVGQQVYHKWSCDASGGAENIFCMTVHSCFVNDNQGREVQLLDESGCALDQFVLGNLDYSDDLVGGQTSMVFKFADQSSLFFQCQIRLSLKEGAACSRSADSCPDPARGKRSVERQTKTIAVEDGQEVDVFSESITIFDIDEPLTEKLDSQEIAALNKRRDRISSEDFSKPSGMCLSPITFGVLVSVLAVVLLASLMTVLLLCIKSSPRIEQMKGVS